jgi:hypothetical protein
MKSSHSLIAATLSAGLAMSGLAYAQQPGQQNEDQQSQQLSNRDARQFMQRVERDVNQMMQSGNMGRLRQWLQNNVADNAVFSGTREIGGNGRSTAVIAATLTKQDLMRLQRFVLSALSDREFPSSQDFNLNIQVTNVQPIGDAAAMVRTRITESRTVGNQQQSENDGSFGNGQSSRNQQFSRNQQAFTEGAAPQQRFAQRQGQQGGVQLDTQATCTHLLERNPDSGNIQIAMEICNAQTETQQ